MTETYKPNSLEWAVQAFIDSAGTKRNLAELLEASGKTNEALEVRVKAGELLRIAKNLKEESEKKLP